MKKNEDNHGDHKKEHDLLAKILIIGDGGVGKTALINRFTEDRFYMSYTATIGVDFRSKIIQCNDKIIKLQIWDTAGQQRFKNITQAYYRGAAGIVLTFSLVDRVSFQNIEKWIHQIEENASKDCTKVLVATKLDSQSERVIARAEAEALAMKMGLTYIETSSKDNLYVNEMFDLLGKQIYESMIKKNLSGNNADRNIKISSRIFSEDKKEQSRCRC